MKKTIGFVVILGLVFLLIYSNPYVVSAMKITYYQNRLTPEFLSKEYNLKVSNEFLNYQQGQATFYGMDKESNKAKYIFFYLQRDNMKSSIYEVFAERGVNKEEAVQIIKNNHVEYQNLNLSIFSFYLGDKDNDIREFLYWHTDAQLIDSTQKPIFIRFTTGEVFRDEELLVQ